MFVQVTDYHGNNISIDPLRVIKIRAAGIADEPMNTMFIDYVSGGTFVKGTAAKIVKLFGTYIRLAPLHAPNGLPIYINADGIAAVDVDPMYDGKSVAIVAAGFENPHVLARNKIALRETVAEARAVLESVTRVA